MSAGSAPVTVQCLSLREYFSPSNLKSMVRGFVYEYETPKIVTIHSISIALTCRIIQLLILIYGIVYLMIHKKGYQETNTSIISSITLKVKGIGYNQTGNNQTLVIDGADYIVPPQENNALFLMTNFIRTDQEHSRCPESPDEKISECLTDAHCQKNRDFQKANGKWTGRCRIKNTTFANKSRPLIGRCELEGWCPVENDRDIPKPIRDALNFTIFIKNFIEFPRFQVIRKNIQQDANYLKKCNFDPFDHPICPIFRVGTILDLVESDPEEQLQMLTLGGVIRVKIDWKCNLDKPLNTCLPDYSFGRLDAKYKEESFSQGFNFRFASHWKHEKRSFRTLTKAFGLRFIISVSGQAGRFDVITLSLNIGSLIGILGLATFICDIVALYVHRSSDVYRQQKFQDVDLNLLRLETLNSLAEGMVSEVAKRKHQSRVDEAILSENIMQNAELNGSMSSPIITSSNHSHAKPSDGLSGLAKNHLSSSIKQKRSPLVRPKQLHGDSYENDKINIMYVDEESPTISETTKIRTPIGNGNDRSTPKIETFL